MKCLDLTGQRFGKLTVLGIDPNHKYNSSKTIVWKCQCDCGEICYKTATSLKSPIKTVGVVKACSKKCGASIPIGSKFGKLTVLENIYLSNKTTKSKCQCDCGNIVIVESHKLKNGGVKSCGCLKAEKMSNIGKTYSKIENLQNIKFGKLTALSPTDKRQNRSVIWKCQCECGNIHYASVSNLKSGSVTQCSECKTHSKGENKIAKILSEFNIPFVQEKTFETCRASQSGRQLRFDFFVNNQYLIEFDGIQHFQEGGWNTFERFQATQQRDQEKNHWCKENNIPLIRIPYTELDFLDIKQLRVKTTKFLVK